ncbi:MAG: SIMPL domain-containing protein, partial [bacterium]
AEAVKNAARKAEVLADAAGVKLGPIIRIDYTWSDIYIESNLSIRAFMVSESAPDYDFTPEDIEITETVTTVWEIEG